MMIGNLRVIDYEGKFGSTNESSIRMMDKIQESVRSCLQSISVNNLDIYKLNTSRHSHLSETPISKKRIVMFVNATRNKTSGLLLLETPEKINGIENKITSFLPPAEEGFIIASETGIPLAQWNEKYCSLDILFDLFSDDGEEHLKIFEFIMREFDRLVLLPLTYENSWVHAKDKASLTARFTETIRQQNERQVESDKRRAKQLEDDIRSYMRSIKSCTDEAIRCRKAIETEVKTLEELSKNLINDLDLIIAHEKVTDLRIEDGKFIISTIPLYITSDKGKRYYGGSYKIELELQNTNVCFFGDNPRKSYWTEYDPHPHVNGKNGHACLGNTSGTIAELCSQMQIYALVLICIDFLESANTTDPAGACVKNWDEVDKDNNIIPIEKRAVLYRCDNCEEEVEELFDVYEGYEEPDDDDEDDDDEGGLYDHSRVCADCRTNHYHWNERTEAYIRD